MQSSNGSHHTGLDCCLLLIAKSPLTHTQLFSLPRQDLLSHPRKANIFASWQLSRLGRLVVPRSRRVAPTGPTLWNIHHKVLSFNDDGVQLPIKKTVMTMQWHFDHTANTRRIQGDHAANMRQVQGNQAANTRQIQGDHSATTWSPWSHSAVVARLPCRRHAFALQ